ncbi:TTF-type domain-containing protein [Citrus sinensis]|nr:TTF-type domain-containing protein [Citrus sinensis]
MNQRGNSSTTTSSDSGVHDEIRRAYIRASLYQPVHSKNPHSRDHGCSFQSSWYFLFPTWLDYSIANDVAFCLPYFLFNKPSRHKGAKAFTLCIIVDEARDESKKEQMAIVLRFVDKDGIVRERFFGLVHVSETSAQILKKRDIFCEWNGLQALILKDCPYAYYIHCLAHRLQLTLVAASRVFKRAKVDKIAHMLALDELKIGKGFNQIGTLQRTSETRWGSHFKSVSSLINMFSATCEFLINIMEDGVTYPSRGDADATYEAITSFEFVFILHLMKNIMTITDLLSQALQCQSQDIFNVMRLVSSTNQNLLENVISFCKACNIDISNMNTRYIARQCRARYQENNFTMEQHYWVNIFYAAIDSQLQELNIRFNDSSVELLMLSSVELLMLSLVLDPREGYKSFRIDDICQLVDKFYRDDFTDNEKIYLRVQLDHYNYNVVQDPKFKNLSSLSDLCQWLIRTRRSSIYPLFYKIIVLVLTLPTRLRNKMDDDFLTDTLITYIERDIANKISMESVINDFRDMKERKVRF